MFPDDLLIRADASPHMGTGHVMRCIALAQVAYKYGFKVKLKARVEVFWVIERLKEEKFQVELLESQIPQQEKPENLLKDLSSLKEGSWVVLDGYHFGLDCQKAVQNAGYKLLVIDDYKHLAEYSCDILLNQNIGAEKFDYSGAIGTFCCGLRYTLLRQEFIDTKKESLKNREKKELKNVLVNMGGGNFIGSLVELSQDFEHINWKNLDLSIISGAMSHTAIREVFQAYKPEVQVLGFVSSMPDLLKNCDLCISAGGSTCWELAYLGVPFLAKKIAENQHYVIDGLKKANPSFIYSLETLKKVMHSRELQIELSEQGQRIIDGLGSERVCKKILEF